MSTYQRAFAYSIAACLTMIISLATAQDVSNDAVKRLQPKDFQHWILPAEPPYPVDNKPTPARIELGKMLFFDPRASRDGNMSCATCHTPMLGWSDGLATGRGFQSKLLSRTSPTLINTAYNSIQMWDGRRKELEDQVMGPMKGDDLMNTDLDSFFKMLNSVPGYKTAFAEAYPGEEIGAKTFSKAVAAYERTIISRTSPFDRWVAGDKKAMSTQQLRGMILFNDKNKTNCVACHSAPNFTDNGFHNLGLASFGNEKPDMGRFTQKAVAINKGAFKTPTLRDVDRTAPYFHDGSARTLMDVVEHYNKGGVVHTNLSPNIKPLNLQQSEKEDLVAFMKALSSPQMQVAMPILPLE